MSLYGHDAPALYNTGYSRNTPFSIDNLLVQKGEYPFKSESLLSSVAPGFSYVPMPHYNPLNAAYPGGEFLLFLLVLFVLFILHII